jgi:hypothetical protein
MGCAFQPHDQLSGQSKGWGNGLNSRAMLCGSFLSTAWLCEEDEKGGRGDEVVEEAVFVVLWGRCRCVGVGREEEGEEGTSGYNDERGNWYERILEGLNMGVLMLGFGEES